ncbi:MAG: hypothetical protein GF334_02075 [Candidatus Altiarchaeales archaeon]|nr:hypothetical protein [Candidatus Altiarchaeales archaeon]
MTHSVKPIELSTPNYTVENAYELHKRFCTHRKNTFFGYIKEKLYDTEIPESFNTPKDMILYIITDPWIKYNRAINTFGDEVRKVKNYMYLKYTFEVPFEDLPLHINQNDRFLNDIISWRLDIGK